MSILIFLFSIQSLFACPRLMGEFHCPKTKNQPAFDFKLSRNLDGTKTIYTFEYSHLPEKSVTVASAQGEFNKTKDSNFWAYCTKTSLIYLKDNDTSGYIQQSYLTKNRTFIAKVRGEVVAACPSK